MKGKATSASPLGITQNNTTNGQLITITNGTGASFTAMTVGVDTTALKSFLAGKVSIVANAPLSGAGTTASPLTITTGDLTAGTLLQTTGTPTGASLKTAGYQVDTNALKTMLTNAGYDNSTDRFVENAGNTVVSAGNVGIGNTAPSAKLEVTGNTKVTDRKSVV